MTGPSSKKISVCYHGHKFIRSKETPRCPACTEVRTGFIEQLPAPAQRALESAGIKTLRQLASKTEDEILALHGIGKTSLPVLLRALKKGGLAFKSGRRKS